MRIIIIIIMVVIYLFFPSMARRCETELKPLFVLEQRVLSGVGVVVWVCCLTDFMLLSPDMRKWKFLDRGSM